MPYKRKGTREFLAAPLSPQQQKFVHEYLIDGNGTRAAIAAGYPEKFAGNQASDMVQHHVGVRAAILCARDKVSVATGYTAIEAMKECESAMEFARNTQNANALCKAIELRARLQGLLVDRLDVKQLAAFSVKIVGLDNPPEPPANVAATMETLKLAGVLKKPEEEEEDDGAGDIFK